VPSAPDGRLGTPYAGAGTCTEPVRAPIPHLPEMLIAGRKRELWIKAELVEDQMRKVADNVERAEVFVECGHSLALEADDRLATLLREFMLGR
jgi:pimeloyl-ACP methyl ester carboxylesterase